MSESRSRSGLGRAFVGLAIVATAIAVAFFVARSDNPISEATLKYQPRKGGGDTGGYQSITSQLQPWTSDTPMEEIIAIWKSVGPNFRGQLDEQLAVQLAHGERARIEREAQLIAELRCLSACSLARHGGYMRHARCNRKLDIRVSGALSSPAFRRRVRGRHGCSVNACDRSGKALAESSSRGHLSLSRLGSFARAPDSLFFDCSAHGGARGQWTSAGFGRTESPMAPAPG